MEPLSFTEHLKQAGLTEDQARLYESLVERGPSPASLAARKAGLSRTLAYKILSELEVLGLVSKQEEAGKVTLFTASHPLALKEMAERKEREAKDALSALEGVMGAMTSAYNLAGGKPGVEFYEGEEGIRKVIMDTLKSKSELLSYADIEAVGRYAKPLNDEYVALRKHRNIKKRMLVLETPTSRAFYGNKNPDITDVRFIKAPAEPFGSVMHIYDGKISYLTLSEERLLGVIIHDEHIFRTHKYLFEFAWEHSNTTQKRPIPTTPG